MRFAWDPNKAAANLKKHGVSFEEAQDAQDEMRVEYDFDYSTAVRGKYYRRLLKKGANIVVLERDVAKAFRSSAAVNEVLRSLIKVARAASGKAEASAPLTRKRRVLASG